MLAINTLKHQTEDKPCKGILNKACGKTPCHGIKTPPHKGLNKSYVVQLCLDTQIGIGNVMIKIVAQI